MEAGWVSDPLSTLFKREIFALPGIEQRCFSCRAFGLVTTDSAMPAAFCNNGRGEIRPYSLVSLDILLCCQIYCFRLFSDCQFLGAFAKLRKATVSFVMSVCPSARLHGTTRLPLDRFS